MGVYEARSSLTKAMKHLLALWSEAKTNWDDPVSRDFEQRYITSLEMDLKMALSAMDHMSVLLQQIRRDCE